jgi:hypothetical protein
VPSPFLDFVDVLLPDAVQQTVLGYSPLAAGAAYLPLTVGVGISSGIGAKLLTKTGSRAVICAGAAIASVGLFLLAHVPVHGTYLADILPGLMLEAFGIGPVFVGVTTAANAGVTPDKAGLAAAILNSAQQVGGALGLAIFSAVAASRTSHLLATGVSAPLRCDQRLRPCPAHRRGVRSCGGTAGTANRKHQGGPDGSGARRPGVRQRSHARRYHRSRPDPHRNYAKGSEMTINTVQHSVLIVGRSQFVLDGAVDGLLQLG